MCIFAQDSGRPGELVKLVRPARVVSRQGRGTYTEMVFESRQSDTSKTSFPIVTPRTKIFGAGLHGFPHPKSSPVRVSSEQQGSQSGRLWRCSRRSGKWPVAPQAGKWYRRDKVGLGLF